MQEWTQQSNNHMINTLNVILCKKKAFRRTIHSVIRTSQNVKRSCRKVFLAKQLLFLVFRSDWQKNSDISGFSLGLVNLLSEKDSITQQPVKRIKTSATIFTHMCTRRNSKRMKVRRQWDMKPSSTVEITHTAHTKKKGKFRWLIKHETDRGAYVHSYWLTFSMLSNFLLQSSKHKVTKSSRLVPNPKCQVHIGLHTPKPTNISQTL